MLLRPPLLNAVLALARCTIVAAIVPTAAAAFLAYEAGAVAAIAFLAVPFVSVAATATSCAISTVATVEAAFLDVATTAPPAPLPAVSATAAMALLLAVSAATLAAAFPAVSANASVAAMATRAAYRRVPGRGHGRSRWMSRVRPLRHLPRLVVGRGKDGGSDREVVHPGGPGRGCTSVVTAVR